MQHYTQSVSPIWNTEASVIISMTTQCPHNSVPTILQQFATSVRPMIMTHLEKMTISLIPLCKSWTQYPALHKIKVSWLYDIQIDCPYILTLYMQNVSLWPITWFASIAFVPFPISPSWWYWHSKSVGPLILIYKAKSPYSDRCQMFRSDMGRFCKKYFCAPPHNSRMMILPWNIRESSQSDIQRKVPIFQYMQGLTSAWFFKEQADTVYNWRLKMLYR